MYVSVTSKTKTNSNQFCIFVLYKLNKFFKTLNYFQEKLKKESFENYSHKSLFPKICTKNIHTKLGEYEAPKSKLQSSANQRIISDGTEVLL